MRTNISKSIRHSLLVDENGFEAPFGFLSKQFEHVELTADCVDGSALETEDVTEIMKFDNLNYRRITGVVITARSGTESRAHLSIRSDSTLSDKLFPVSANAKLTVSSQDDSLALYVCEGTLKRLKEMKPWYDPLARIPVVLTFALLWGAYGLSITLAEMIGLRTPRPSSPQLSGLNAFNIFGVAVVAFLGITCPIEIGLKYLFPRVFSLFGKQRRTMGTIEKWRSFVFITLIAGLLVAWIAKRWFG